IKRERATSNICTAQALLATMSGFYAVYHGAEGIKEIAKRIHSYAVGLSEAIEQIGYKQLNTYFFDTLHIQLPEGISLEQFREVALKNRVNFRYFPTAKIGLSIDETTNCTDVMNLLNIFATVVGKSADTSCTTNKQALPKALTRTSTFLSHEVFKKYHTETEMMRYIKRLDRQDISLAHSMISLGSCTMKLNAAAEVIPMTRPEFMHIHPLAPKYQAKGSLEMIENLGKLLKTITGFDGISLQPNSGAAGEYAGLRTIRAYLESIKQGHRSKVLIPASAHGTNPASAVQAGYDIVIVKSDEGGNVSMDDFRAKVEEHKDELAALMITYPSTHGIFEKDIVEMCELIHKAGGQVYMDGANMNGQVGLTNPGFIGADVCHLNLHKTFAIPHGGGGPGVGPICCAKHLIP
ncbi:MAG: aminotransferase class V-fold PLP-dependent enzyme, partial [Bacteroides sp.]